ncbi:MAG: hypothetical protein K2M17_01325 [Bacilli bacterium]|nr:hypothetical protein [Bacilli bacterium]
MSKIIQIDTLYDIYHCIYFGYVGIDLETGKVRYFKNFSNDGKYFSDKLWEFDMSKASADPLLFTHLQYCNYYRLNYVNVLPLELKQQANILINRHASFNIENGLPTTYLDFNSQNLSIRYRKSRAPSYDYLENTIFLNTCKDRWKKMPDNLKKQAISSLIHELGHMKVRRYKLDEINNKLYLGTGFRNIEIDLSPTYLENGDIFYKSTIKEAELEKDLSERTLEEITNDLECSLAFPEFVGRYPKFGERLNKLCDNRILVARYYNGLEEYYNSLYEIINSKDLATELLESMRDSIYGDDTYHSEKRAYQLIKKYEEKKFR